MSGEPSLPPDAEARLRVVEGAPSNPKDLRERIKDVLDDEVAISGIEAVLDYLRGEDHGLSRDERGEVVFRLVRRSEEAHAQQPQEGQPNVQA